MSSTHLHLYVKSAAVRGDILPVRMTSHHCLHYAVLLLLLTSAILVWVVWQLEVTAPMCGYTSTTTSTRTKVLLLAYSRSVAST